MNDLLSLAVEQANGALRPAVLTFLRVGAAMAVLPAFGEIRIPARIRLAAAIAFTAIVAPVTAHHHADGPFVLPALAETLAGLLVGLSLRLMVLALQTAAAIAAQAASLSQLFASAGAEPMPALGTLLTLAALALAVQAGLHVRLAELFVLSYDLLPAGRIPAAADVADWGVSAVGHATALAFSLALPFVIAALLWNIALGIVNRAMPHLMVAFVGAPALAWGGLLVAALAAPFLLQVWLAAFRGLLSDPFPDG
ncbi:MAG: flagellar biosynthesis protein FliR [Rhodobacter sp. CACIA14H1]|nr:MAG: flagellar biosynthesis protein FliR [Rhodobacter sp. CACIA14H1]